MTSMTLEQASFIAEIIGVFAVVASLVHLALQLRQNTTAVRLSTLHDVKRDPDSERSL